MQYLTTCERWRGPTGGASVLPTSVLKVGGTKKTRSVVESSEGLEKEGSDTIKTTITKSDLVRSLLGDGENQGTFGGNPRPDDGRNVLRTWRTLAVDGRGLDQTNSWCGKRSVTAPPPRSTRRRGSSSTDTKTSQGVSESNTCTGTEEHCSVPVPPFWSVTGQSGTAQIQSDFN